MGYSIDDLHKGVQTKCTITTLLLFVRSIGLADGENVLLGFPSPQEPTLILNDISEMMISFIRRILNLQMYKLVRLLS